MVEAKPQVVMTLTNTTKINEVLQRMETLLSILDIISCVGVTNIHGAYKQNPTTFCLPDTHPYMKCLHKLNETPPDMTPTSLTSGTYQTVSTMASTGSSFGTSNMFCWNC